MRAIETPGEARAAWAALVSELTTARRTGRSTPAKAVTECCAIGRAAWTTTFQAFAF
jgi:hypothetical protein